ncbi:hypothetical protein DFH08DRAFT_717528, partial [Mycena albidolilacea]
GCDQTYIVKSGDTCSSIESQIGISDAQLHALNPTIDSGCTNLSVDQALCVSGSGCAQKYVVVSGDTCSAIESHYSVSDALLHALNPAINSGCTNLFVGQTLCLSGGCAQTYTVVSGDTCSAIASNTGVSDAQLHALNPAINSGCTSMFRILFTVYVIFAEYFSPDLSVGQTLCLSGGGSGCAQTYTVVSGDTCSAIESHHSITDTQLHALNPSINSGCTSMFPFHLSSQYVLSVFTRSKCRPNSLCLNFEPPS